MSPTLQRLFTVSGLLAFLLSCWLCCVAIFIVVISSEKDLHPRVSFWTEYPDSLLRQIREEEKFAFLRKGIL